MLLARRRENMHCHAELGAGPRALINRVLAAPTRDRVAHDVFGVESGLYVLRPPERPIGLDGDAPGSGPRVDQVERDVRTGIGEQSCALADAVRIGLDRWISRRSQKANGLALSAARRLSRWPIGAGVLQRPCRAA